MANRYEQGVVPEEYDPRWMQEEFRKIASMVQAFELDYVILVTQHAAPAKLREGMVVKADGTNWNPGTGAGVYAYVGGAWVKL